MRAFFLILALLFAASARALAPDFVSIPEEFIFRLEAADTYIAETATADLGPATQSGPFFGSLQIVSRNHIRLNLSGQYFELFARTQHTRAGTCLQLQVPQAAFAATNTEFKRRGAFECIALGADHLRCTQTLYVKNGIPAL